MPTFCWRIRQLCLEPVLEIRWKDGTIIVQHHQVPRFHNLATCGLEVPDSDWTRKPPRPLLGHGLGFRLPIFRIFRFAPETMRSPEVSAGHPWPSRATHRWRGDHPSWGPSDARRWSWSENLWPMWFSDILGTCISILRTYIYIHTSSYIIIYHYISIYYLKKNNYEHLTSDIVHQRISKILQLYLYDLYGVFRKLWRKAAVCSQFGSDASTIQKTCVCPRLIRGIQCTQIHWLGPVSYPPWGKNCSTNSNHITWVYPRIE